MSLIKDFYARKNAVSYRANGTVFISIPVYLKIKSKLYDIYDITPFPVLISDTPQATFSQEPKPINSSQ